MTSLSSLLRRRLGSSLSCPHEVGLAWARAQILACSSRVQQDPFQDRMTVLPGQVKGYVR